MSVSQNIRNIFSVVVTQCVTLSSGRVVQVDHDFLLRCMSGAEWLLFEGHILT